MGTESSAALAMFDLHKAVHYFYVSLLCLSGEPPLQNHRSRGAVDVFATDPPLALTARPLRFQPLVRLQRGQAFLDAFDGKTEAAFQLRGETVGSRRERAGGTVGIIRSAH